MTTECRVGRAHGASRIRSTKISTHPRTANPCAKIPHAAAAVAHSVRWARGWHEIEIQYTLRQPRPLPTCHPLLKPRGGAARVRRSCEVASVPVTQNLRCGRLWATHPVYKTTRSACQLLLPLHHSFTILTHTHVLVPHREGTEQSEGRTTGQRHERARRPDTS